MTNHYNSTQSFRSLITLRGDQRSSNESESFTYHSQQFDSQFVMSQQHNSFSTHIPPDIVIMNYDEEIEEKAIKISLYDILCSKLCCCIQQTI